MTPAVGAESPQQPHLIAEYRAARESTVLRYAYLVKQIAGRLGLAQHPVLDMEDVVAAGTVGLIRAVDHFDSSRGVPFEPYAVACIKGAILDQLRSLDVISRRDRQRGREIGRAMERLQVQKGRIPTDEEVAQEVGLDVESYRRALAEIGPAILSLDSITTRDEDGQECNLLSTLEDTSSPDPASLAEKNGLLEALAEAVSRLEERDRLVLALYYKEELTLREISEVIGVSESRVCQLHTRTVMSLRAQLNRWRRAEGL